MMTNMEIYHSVDGHMVGLNCLPRATTVEAIAKAFPWSSKAKTFTVMPFPGISGTDLESSPQRRDKTNVM